MSTLTRVRSGNAELAVRIDGDEGLPWLLLSNSLATDLSIWDAQIAEFARIRRVVRYDTRGHGGSSAPEGPYSFSDLVGDMVSVLDALDIETADVLGLSIGGMTALGLGLAHPNRVRTVICACARAEFPPPAIAMWDSRIAVARSGGLEKLADETLGRWFTGPFRQQRPEFVAGIRRMITSTSVEGYCGCVEALKTLDYFRHLPRLTRPTHYIAGAADAAAPPEAMQAMAQATPNASLTVIPHAAHIANVENAAAFNAAATAFLQAQA